MKENTKSWRDTRDAFPNTNPNYEPAEHTKTEIKRFDIDNLPDVENHLIDEETQKTILLTLLITLFVFLLNTFGW